MSVQSLSNFSLFKFDYIVVKLSFILKVCQLYTPALDSLNVSQHTRACHASPQPTQPDQVSARILLHRSARPLITLAYPAPASAWMCMVCAVSQL